MLLVLLNVGSSYAGGQWAAGDEPLYYIVSPKDVVIARPRSVGVPRTGKPSDRYVPPISGSTGWYGKP
ncbi:hypothetical protein GW17_00044602 [Ensete ventricosum]|nr:hypothetical protein GW17_00044602 [Ensete ventricosum]